MLNISKQQIILIIVISILLAGNIVFSLNYLLAQREIQELEKSVEKQQLNTRIINFSRLFVEKVLKAKEDISFEERLKLENAVREIDDKDLLSSWEEFTSSKTEEEAQENVKDLLDLLTRKFSF